MTDCYMIVDTETTDYAPQDDGNILDARENLHSWEDCRMLEVAWLIFDQSGRQLKQNRFLIKPPLDQPFNITPGAFAVHKITNDRLFREGTDINSVFDHLLEDITTMKVKWFVAHNVAFDFNVVLSEALRANRDGISENLAYLMVICTLGIARHKRVGGPYNLSSLYWNLFKKPPYSPSHTAMADAKTCAEIFFHLRHPKVIINWQTEAAAEGETEREPET